MFSIAVKTATSFYRGKSQHDAQVEAMHRIDEKLKSMDMPSWAPPRCKD